MSRSSIELRKKLVQLVGRYPGLHLRELARQAGLTEAHASYHLGLLVGDGFVTDAEDGGFRRYYPLQPKPMGEKERALLALLRQPVPLQIALYLLEHEAATHTELTAETKLSKSTVTYHLKKLESAEFVGPAPAGQGYSLRDPARVRAILTRWEPSAQLTQKFHGLWGRFYSGQSGRR